MANPYLAKSVVGTHSPCGSDALPVCFSEHIGLRSPGHTRCSRSEFEYTALSDFAPRGQFALHHDLVERPPRSPRPTPNAPSKDPSDRAVAIASRVFLV